ncbi:DUF4358 domain-containing protein [Eubacteriales bacterium OttesenSCG-928-M02]|nr:DUF4358 domain-containing protein [Eubacteriales bacterium OttesenSCG-928-M02]
MAKANGKDGFLIKHVGAWGWCALLCALLVGCGQDRDGERPWMYRDVRALYHAVESAVQMPEMLAVDGNMAHEMFGIAEADVAQGYIAICGDSLLADEVWVIEAVDEKALKRIEALARARIDQKDRESAGYAPKQNRIVKNAQILIK